MSTNRIQRREYDFVVCGGGLAGFCAAVAAAREGLRTALVQDRPVLGGNASSEIRVDVHGAGTYWPWAVETGVIAEVIDEERFRNGEEVAEGHLNSIWDLVLYEWAMREAGLDLYLSTSARDVVMAKDAPEGRIAAIRCGEQGSGAEYELAAPVFLDATGDGTIAALAGAEFRYGREAKSEFDESFAPEQADAVVQGSTIQFRARDLGRPVPFVAPEWAVKYPSEESIFWRGHSNPTGGYWWIEIGSPPLHTVDDAAKIRHELLRHVLGVFDHLKNHCENKDAAADLTLDWVGAVPGKRESRRILGDLLLNENHLREKTPFADRVAYGGWFIDLHVPGGILAMNQRPEPSAYDNDVKDRSQVGPYPIPLRALRCRDVRNLLLAGRDISATHVALGSTRVMGTCAVIGQATAAAATVAHRLSKTLDALNEADVAAVQQLLLKQDCYIPGVRNEDPADLARTATVTADSAATLELSVADDWLELTRPTMQLVPITADRVDAVELLLDNRGDGSRTMCARLRRREDVWDLSDGEDLAVCEAVLPAGDARWCRFEFGATVEAGLYAVTVDPAEDVWWSQRRDPHPGTAVATKRESGHWRFEGQRGKWVAQAIRLTPRSRPFEAENVTNGVARPTGMPNLWISDPAAALPQALALTLPAPAAVAEVRLAFDSDLGRNVRSTPPLFAAPQLARDYRVDLLVGGAWRTVVEEHENRRRHRVHRFEPRAASAVRLTILAAGCGQGRVYEIRVYGPKQE